MATTQKGIYYPDDYTAVADVPEDMKKQAESVDAALGNIEDTIEQDIQTQIDDINEEQTTQNNEITALQTENTRLKATLPTTTGEGENTTLDKTAEMEFVKPPLPRGNTTQNQYVGKNLLSLSSISATEEGVTITLNNDGTITLNGTATSSINRQRTWLKDILSYKTNSSYTYSARYVSGSMSGTRLAINIRSGTTTSSTSTQFNTPSFELAELTQDASQTFTSPSTAGYITGIQFIFSEDVTFNNYTFKFQLEEGSTATSYEPYVGGTASPNPSFPSPIHNVTGDAEVLVQNKNLFDKDDVINAYLNADGTTTSNNTFRVSNYINVKGLDNITISGNYGGSEYCCFYDKNKDFLSNFGMGTLTTRTASVPSNAEYIRVTVRQDVLNEYQLEKGSTATTYTQHKEQAYTFPLGTQRMYLGDYLADDGIHHVRGQVTFDGSQDETWWIRSDTHEIRTGMLSSYNAVSGSDILCNQLIQVNSYTEGANGVRWVLNSQDICIHSNDINTSTMTIEEWREYLSENPLVMEFGISTEEITPYTEPQQTAYDEIKQAISYDEQTNISGTSDGANPIFNVEAYQSIKLVLQEISNAVVALGGV